MFYNLNWKIVEEKAEESSKGSISWLSTEIYGEKMNENSKKSTSYSEKTQTLKLKIYRISGISK